MAGKITWNDRVRASFGPRVEMKMKMDSRSATLQPDQDAHLPQIVPCHIKLQHQFIFAPLYLLNPPPRPPLFALTIRPLFRLACPGYGTSRDKVLHVPATATTSGLSCTQGYLVPSLPASAARPWKWGRRAFSFLAFGPFVDPVVEKGKCKNCLYIRRTRAVRART